MKPTIDADPARRLNNAQAWLVVLALAPGLIVLGWRAALVMLGVVVVAAMTRRAMIQDRLPRPRRWPPTWPLETLLLCGLLPAELASIGPDGSWTDARWFLIPSAAILLVLAQRVRRAIPWPAFDPVVVTILILYGIVGASLTPIGALDKRHIVLGDVAEAQALPATPAPWFAQPQQTADLQVIRPLIAATEIDRYLAGRLDQEELSRGSNLDALIRDRLPPIEDVLLLGHPRPIGQCSGVALIGLILWASYRRLINWRIPLAAIATCYLLLVLLPTPTSIAIDGRNWRVFAALHVDVGAATALTFVHYVLFTSPALFAIGLLATRGEACPINGRAALVWAAILGALMAVAMLYASVTVGPLLALLPAPLLARWADRWLARRPLTLTPR